MSLDGRRLIVGIAGGSGSGKTTLAGRLVAECEKFGIRGALFSLDHYYKSRDELGFEQRSALNFDHPDAIDIELAAEHLRRLKGGGSVDQPTYDFKLHVRAKAARRLEAAPLVVVEGIYALYPKEFLDLYDFKVFVSTGLATAVLRRIQRDVLERGRDLAGAKHQILATVLPMYEAYIKPTQRNAHFSINWDGEEIPDKAVEGLVRMVRDVFS